MEIQNILELVLNQGVWCALFVYFYWNTDKKNSEREAAYQSMIAAQTEKLGEVSETLKAIDTRLSCLEGGHNNESSD